MKWDDICTLCSVSACRLVVLVFRRWLQCLQDELMCLTPRQRRRCCSRISHRRTSEHAHMPQAIVQQRQSRSGRRLSKRAVREVSRRHGITPQQQPQQKPQQKP